MDHEGEARGVRRWGIIGAAIGGVAGFVLGVSALVGGEGAALLWSAPAFACMGAGLLIGLRARTAFTYSELGGMPWSDRRRHIGRHVVPLLALLGAGIGFLVLSGVTEL